ncbi:MAG: protein kinase, partial [Pirellulales bacterium]
MIGASASESRDDQRRAGRIRQVVEDAHARRAAGEELSDDSVLKAHADLLPELAEALRKANGAPPSHLDSHLLETQAHGPNGDASNGDDPSSAKPKTDSGLKVRCPHCRNYVETIVDGSWRDITCTSCGSHFSLVDESTETRTAAAVKSIGHFDLIEQIGAGAFGTVWKARDRDLDRTVAVKIPRKGQLETAEAEQFLREARAAAQLHHPCIVSVHEVGRDGDTIFIVSDIVRGV